MIEEYHPQNHLKRLLHFEIATIKLVMEQIIIWGEERNCLT